MTMNIYESLLSFTVNICFQNAFVTYVSGDASPDIQHLRALAMFLCIDCTRPPPDPILDIGHMLIGDRENMLIGRSVYATFVAHLQAFFLITSQTRNSFTGI